MEIKSLKLLLEVQREFERWVDYFRCGLVWVWVDVYTLLLHHRINARGVASSQEDVLERKLS
jgi:hypothetical protein